MKGETVRKRANKRSLSKRGVNNPRARLTARDVAKIRRLIKRNGHKYGYKAEIARQFGISQGYLCDIIAGNRWKHTKKGAA